MIITAETIILHEYLKSIRRYNQKIVIYKGIPLIKYKNLLDCILDVLFNRGI
jgi:hypothetical protein